MKKILFAGIFVFAFALTMNVAFAGCPGPGCGQPQCPCPDQSNTAIGVTNTTSAQAVSGMSKITGAFVGSGTIISGPSIAKVTGVNAVNSNVKIGGFSMMPQPQTNSAMMVENGTGALATSGGGEISGMVVGGGYINSGISVSKVKGFNLVNTNIKW